MKAGPKGKAPPGDRGRKVLAGRGAGEGRSSRAGGGSGGAVPRRAARRAAGSVPTRKGGSPGGPGAAGGPASGSGAGPEPQAQVLRITELEQIKVLADPLRIRILELLCEERTTKQVAGILGQPPTRLYHHVAALERVGLIRLARTKQSRGALEKYYVAVAKTFSADPRLFAPAGADEAGEATQGVAAQILENTAEDLRTLLRSGGGSGALSEGGVLSYLEVRGSPKQLRAIRGKLMKLLDECAAGRGKPEGSGPGHRLMIAFFPLAGGPRSSD